MKTPLRSLVAVGFSLAQVVSAQLIVYSDDFSTSQGASYTTSGDIGSSSWGVTRSGDDWGGEN